MRTITFYYRQIDRKNGELLGFITYDNYKPNNDNDKILLEEMNYEEYISSLNTDYSEEEV